MLFRSFHSSATMSSGFPGYFWNTLIVIRSGEFRESFLISWCLLVSYHKEEFDNTARYHNHQDEASCVKWLSLHDGSVPAAKLKQASKEEPSKEKNIPNKK